MLPSSDFQILNYHCSLPHRSNPPHIPPLEPIVLQTASTWTHAGPPLNPTSLPQSYHTWSHATFKSGTILPLLSSFLSFLNNFITETHMTHYCLTIRAQKATSDFNIPRWHVDRRFFEDPSSVGGKGNENSGTTDLRAASTWKLATALVGPGTLFLKDGAKGIALQKEVEKKLRLEQKKKGHYAVDEEHVCRTFRCLGCADMAETVRFRLAKEVDGLEIVQVEDGEVAVFRVEGTGDDFGEPAMHSEPAMSDGDRVFVHVVPGREEELRRLMEGWGMEFPKDWSVGVLQEWVV